VDCGIEAGVEVGFHGGWGLFLEPKDLGTLVMDLTGWGYTGLEGFWGMGGARRTEGWYGGG
jgi:hypothetical protein